MDEGFHHTPCQELYMPITSEVIIFKACNGHARMKLIDLKARKGGSRVPGEPKLQKLLKTMFQHYN